MLEIVKISEWTHRPPNRPQWRVEYNRKKANGRTRTGFARYVFADDEMDAWVDTVRWYNEFFRRSDSQKA